MIYPASAAEVLGINARMLNVVDIGGASPAGMIWRAAAAIDAGMCNAVLCIVADLNRMGDQSVPVVSVQREFEAPYGNIGANCGYAMIANRHMYEYGTTPQQMAKVAVDQRTNALKNPLATFNDKALTIDDVLNSRMIVDPLHLFEIVSPCSGGSAVIVASPEVAKRAKNPPIWLLGAGEYCQSLVDHLRAVADDVADQARRRERLQDGGVRPQGYRPGLPLRLLHDHGARHARGRGLLQERAGRTVRRRSTI